MLKNGKHICCKRNAQNRSSLEAGKTKRFEIIKDTDLRKAEIIHVLPYRSYDFRTDNRATFHLTSKHARFLVELPIAVNHETVDISFPPDLPKKHGITFRCFLSHHRNPVKPLLYQRRNTLPKLRAKSKCPFVIKN